MLTSRRVRENVSVCLSVRNYSIMCGRPSRGDRMKAKGKIRPNSVEVFNPYRTVNTCSSRCGMSQRVRVM
jgi:hypothetical protein